MIEVQPVILCGGSGARLWPLSRTGFPKQFLCLIGNESLFQQAAKRLATLANSRIQVAQPLIVTGEEHCFLALEQLREVNIELGAALLEPVGRNTAPALTIAALCALEKGCDPILVVTPANQTVTDGLMFTKSIQSAIYEADNGTIVILGTQPDTPETGYGYIQCDSSDKNNEARNVKRFVEKPDANLVQTYLNKGAITGTPACLCSKPHSGLRRWSNSALIF